MRIGIALEPNDSVPVRRWRAVVLCDVYRQEIFDLVCSGKLVQ